MHHVRTFFLCGMTFLYCVMFILNMFIFKRKAYCAFCLPQNCQHGRCLSAKDRIRSGQIQSRVFRHKKCSNLSSWRTSHSTEKLCHREKMSSRGAFQCTTWLVWNNLAASKALLRGPLRFGWKLTPSSLLEDIKTMCVVSASFTYKCTCMWGWRLIC